MNRPPSAPSPLHRVEQGADAVVDLAGELTLTVQRAQVLAVSGFWYWLGNFSLFQS
jgi:hypothetical protein